MAKMNLGRFESWEAFVAFLRRQYGARICGGSSKYDRTRMGRRELTKLMREEHGFDLSEYAARRALKQVRNLGPLGDGEGGRDDLETSEEEIEQMSVEGSVYNALAWAVDKEYHYHEAADEYEIYVKKIGQWLRIPGIAWREIIKWYTEDNLTLNQTAQKAGMPRKWVEALLGQIGITHDSLPFSSEDLETLAEGELTVKALEMKRARVAAKIEKAELRQLQKDAQAFREITYHWNKQREELAHVLNEQREWIEQEVEAGRWEPRPLEVPSVITKRDSAGHLALMAPSDVHYGSYGWADEVGSGYDRQMCEERLFHKSELLAGRLIRTAPIEKVIVAISGDWFHVDTDAGTTTSGRVSPDADGTPGQIAHEGRIMVCRYVDWLRDRFRKPNGEPTKIVIRIIHGNHDWMLSSAMVDALYAWCRHYDDVEVIVDFKTLQYEVFGDNLLSFTHGHGLVESEKKRLKLSSRIKRETAHYGIVPVWTYLFHGHLHHLKQIDLGGVLQRQLASLGGESRWETRNNYTGSIEGISGAIFHPEEGMIDEVYAPVLPGDERVVALKMSEA